MHDGLAMLGIEQDQIVVVDGRERVARTHQHRQAQAAGEDRAVRIRTAGTGDHAEQSVTGQMRHVGRGDGIGDQDLAHARGELAFLLAGLALQRADHPVDDLVDVFLAAAQVRIVHRLEHPGQTVALLLQRGVGAIAADAHHVVQALQELAVVQQQAVCVDELVDLAGERAAQLAAQLTQFLPRGIERTVQAVQFRVDLVLAERATVDLVAAGLHQPRTAKRHAARSRRAGEYLPHARSPLAACPVHWIARTKRGRTAASRSADDIDVRGSCINHPRRTCARTDRPPPPARRPRPVLRHAR
jgi:hypothetical protein